MELPNEYFYYSSDLEEKLWDDSLFIFDTSALLDLYFYSTDTQDDIFNNIFKRLRGNLFLPHQVNFEYLKHREEKIKAPISTYQSLIKESTPDRDSNLTKKIKKDLDQLSNHFKTLVQRVTSKEKHPNIDSPVLADFQEKINQFQIDTNKFTTKFVEIVNSKIQEFSNPKNVENDIVLEAIKNNFQLGNGFNFPQLMEIIKEGEFRYNNQIPPGYEDSIGKNSKIGAAKYGDLIIWKQILNFCKSKQQNLIFISNDTKEDWCYRENKLKDRVERPREELIQEYFHYTKRLFWIYSMPQFLFHSRKVLKTNIQDKTIDEVEKISKIQIKEKDIVSILVDWCKENISYKQINHDVRIADDLLIDLLIYTTDGKKIGIEIRLLKIHEYHFLSRIKKSNKYLTKGEIDEFWFFFIVDKEMLEDDFNTIELIKGNALNNSRLKIIPGFIEENKFIKIDV